MRKVLGKTIFILVATLQTLFLSSCGDMSEERDSSLVSKPAATSLSLRFQVNSEQGTAIEGASIRALDGQQVVKTTGDGSAVINHEFNRLYQFEVSATGFYPIIHSFSADELSRLNGSVPVIELVEKKPGRVMLAFTGDVMLGRRYHTPNPGEPRHLSSENLLEDSKALLDPIKPYLELADYVSVNLESPVLSEELETRAPKNIVFFSYPETLQALLWAGVDHVSLGNNHSADYLDSGLKETLEHLSASGLHFSGAGLTESDALKASSSVINSVNYSVLGYVGWPGSVTPNQVAGKNKSGAALGTVENIVQSVAKQPEENTTVVEYHGSSEYSGGPSDQTIERLHAAIDAGADLAIGHHPHVLHGFELYKGKLIAYSLGNFLFDQYIYETQRSALLYVWMDNDQFHRAEVVPLYIKGYRPTPAVGSVREYVVRRLTFQSSDGAIAIKSTGGHLALNSSNSVSREEQTTHIHSDYVEQPLSWLSKMESISSNMSDVKFRVGEELWPLGDFENESIFELKSHNWHFSDQNSGIRKENEAENYAVYLEMQEGEPFSSFGQKYFLRVWDEKPKSVVLDVKPSSNMKAQLCLELRSPSMTVSEARASPEVDCLEGKNIESGEWSQIVFDFVPPPQEYRGMRFRFKFYSDSKRDESVVVDNIKFVSWSEQGVLDESKKTLLQQPNKYSVVELGGAADSSCCQLHFTSF